MKVGREVVLILDFGSQYTQLIARRVRELQVYSEIVPHSISSAQVKKYSPSALILSGGPSSVYGEQAPRFDPNIFTLNMPILGICYGLQLLMDHFGGRVHSNGHGEYGFAMIACEPHSHLLKGVNRQTQVWMSHGDMVKEIPEGWEVTARSSNGVVAAVEHHRQMFYGTQFHPEVIHTGEGKKVLANFLFDIAGCRGDWILGSFIDESIRQIRNQVKEERVMCGLSGGVDSSVTAKLLQMAIGNQLKAVFVDHGLIRSGEKEYVLSYLQRQLNVPVHYYDFSANFLSKLGGISDPEAKRLIIGEEFIRSFEKIAEEEGGIQFLAQGTLYPDVIESGGTAGTAEVIKSHHNVGGLPKDMKFELVEPLRDLFKDEVRNVGKELGIPKEILGRHPFPGPGLAVRIIGEVTPERVEILRKADEIYLNFLKQTEIYDEIWQAFCVLIPIKTVGVMGDQRTYDNLIALRAVTSQDGMTADWYRISYDILAEISSKIINRVRGVNRVVYDVSSKPPSTIEWE